MKKKKHKLNKATLAYIQQQRLRSKTDIQT